MGSPHLMKKIAKMCNMNERSQAIIREVDEKILKTFAEYLDGHSDAVPAQHLGRPLQLSSRSSVQNNLCGGNSWPKRSHDRIPCNLFSINSYFGKENKI